MIIGIIILNYRCCYYFRVWDSMNIVKITAFGAAGVILGYYIPYLTENMCKYKMCKNDGGAADEYRLTDMQVLLLCILNAAVWMLAGYRMSRPIPAVMWALLFSLSVLIALIDLKIRIIPNELVLLMLVMGIGFQLADGGLSALPGAALSLVGMMALFTAAAAFVGFGKVGAGDVKLAGAMGFALGYPGILTALLLMCAALIVYIAAGLAMRRLTMRSMFPFAPFMMLGMAAELVLRAVYPQLMLFT